MFLWSDFVFLLVALVVFVHFFFKQKYRYWAELGVPYAEPSFPYGNIGDVGKKFHTAELFQKFYRQFKGKTPLMGFYTMSAPQAMLLDLDVIQRILIKDFSHFQDRARYYNIEHDPLSAHLFNIDGERWRKLRAKISPTFTSGKMKMMLPIVVQVAENLHRTLFKEIHREAEVEIKDYLSRFSTDVIGCCAFGLECNSLENPHIDFRTYGDKAFSFKWRKVIRQNFASSFMSLARKLHIKLLDTDVAAFYSGVVGETVKYRRENGVERNDFLNLLMQIRDADGGQLTLNEIAAQCVSFFLAGFGTSSAAMTFVLYEMAMHRDIQEKARQNVLETLAKYEGKFTYEAAMEMTYLDQVINESLRKYPPLESLSRRVAQDYQVPGTKIVLKKDLLVVIPIHAIQNDPEIFSEPDKFDPERFSPRNTRTHHSAAFMPFGDGPRNCIAKRFGMMQVRIGVATVLKSFNILPSRRTPQQITLKKDSITITPEGGMWLKLERLA